jgi:hypothetical protein
MKGKVEPLSTRNRKVPQSHSRSSSSFSSGKMPPFSSKAISNVATLLLSKQNFNWELKKKIEGL